VRRLLEIRLAYLLGAAFTLLWTGAAGHGQLLLRTVDHWDSLWFARIAEHGYSTKQSAAFLPVYPLLVRGVAFVVRNHVAAGMLVSLTAAAASAWLLLRIARRHVPEETAHLTVLLVALYPAAFVFTAVYSDAVFLCFLLLAVDAAERGRALLAGLAAALAVDTRLLGLALLPTLVLLLRRRAAPVLVLPAVALVLWFLYLHVHYGDWLASSHAEHRYWLREPLSPRWIWHEFRNVPGAISQLVLHLPSPPFPHYVQTAAADVYDFAFLVFGAVFTWVAWKRLGAAFGLYSLLTLAIVVLTPTSWRPLLSTPRFVLADFPVFLALAAVLADRPRARDAVLAGFAALGAVLAVAFARGVLVV
jgi:mannosyltransferase PIG-V